MKWQGEARQREERGRLRHGCPDAPGLLFEDDLEHDQQLALKMTAISLNL